MEFNERKLKGDTNPFNYEMIDYFKGFNIKDLFPKKIWQFNVAGINMLLMMQSLL